MKNFLKLIAAIAICELAGVLGSVFTTPSIKSGWYETLAKPTLTPPSWVFGPVWTTLFALMGIALFLVWDKHLQISGNLNVLKVWRSGIFIFFVQLVLNTLWSIIFFGLQNPGAALIEIILLWLAILATIIFFAKISKTAAWLLVPYLLWVSFATYLNYAIYTLN